MIRALLAGLILAVPLPALAARSSAPPPKAAAPSTIALPPRLTASAVGPVALSLPTPSGPAAEGAAPSQIEAASRIMLQVPAAAEFLAESYVDPVQQRPLYHKALRAVADAAEAGGVRGRHAALARLLDGGFFGETSFETSPFRGRRVVAVDPKSPAAHHVLPGDEVLRETPTWTRLLRAGPDGTSERVVNLDKRSIQSFALAEFLFEAARVLGPGKEKKLSVAAMKAVMGRLDAYTEYETPEEFKRKHLEMRGSYAGIGVSLKREPDGALRVVEVQRGSAAERAGILPGDVVRAVDGKPSKTDLGSVRRVSRGIRGEPGTPVTLTLGRAGAELEVRVVREIRKSRLVDGRMLPGRVGYIHLASFAGDVAEQIARKAAKMKRYGARSLVLDLRFNGGGDMRVATALAGVFLGPGKHVVSMERRGAVPEMVFTPDTSAPALGLPLIVLVNRYSASASEILAAALREQGGALVVGEPTFGKGVGQHVIPLEQGRAGALKATTFRWLTPRGRRIDKKSSVAPDVAVTVPEEEAMKTYAAMTARLAGDEKTKAPDPVLERALEEARRLSPAP